MTDDYVTRFNSKTGKVIRRDYYGNFTTDDWINYYIEGVEDKLENFKHIKRHLGPELQIEFFDEMISMFQFMKDKKSNES